MLNWKNQNQKNLIYSLYKKNGDISAGTDEILATSREFYYDLCKKKGADTTLQNKILKSLNAKLSNVDKAECDKILQEPEILDAVTELSLGKTPGPDGLPVEFYRTMWSFIKDDYVTMVEQLYQTQNLSYIQRNGTIRLTFKKEDRYNLKNYRPVSLINVDVKITKALAKRIGKVLPGIIYKNQISIHGRNISYNIHNLIDIIKYANTKNIQAAILVLDQEKAFYRINHGFLINTLNYFNFGKYFTNWVKIMLKDITRQIKINGFLSEEIIIERRSTQGDPLKEIH